jgi:hypothetical protein
MSLAARGQIITPDPNIPPLYPSGVYRSPDTVFATYGGAGLSIVLTDVEIRVLSRSYSFAGPNEIEDLTVSVPGKVSVNGSPAQPANGSGPSTWVAFGKAGNTTGTFNTEMLSMNLSGTSPFGPFMIRESPTLASLGQTSITDIGGGLYRIDSFFDVFTELSIDGGQTWMPDTSGPARVDLMPVPEPSLCAFAGLAIAALVSRRRR